MLTFNMKNKKIETSKISRKSSDFILELLEKNFEYQFGNIQHFFDIKKHEKNEINVSTALQEIVKNNNIKEDKKELPEIITFLENPERLTSSINKNMNSHHSMFKLSKSHKKIKKETDLKSDLKSAKKNVLTIDQLKNDVALQRLLEESQFLRKGPDSSTFSLNPTGKQRYKILEKRLELLGGKNVKEKIPFKIRLGMELKAKMRREIANKKAKEAGIVQALPASKSKIKRKRNYGLNEITIGKYHRGMVILSKKDIREVMSVPGFDDKKNKKRKNNNMFNK
ncbi:hypothetical protein PCANB_002123 [Pneumocystis canis]|nr:hypothetical protein PCANB_002123 [Pneumocystis canis]